MFSAIRKRVTYTNVAMTVALVFAMSGGAYAAGKYLITSTKQISPKVLASLKGKAGSAGAPGAQGPAGPAGAIGPQGPAGGAGQTGQKGERGEKGETGAAGQNGTTGFTETLPSGKTEKGDWSVVQPASGAEFIATSVSFVIPLKEAAQAIYVKAPTTQEDEHREFPPTPAGCTGNVEEPGAEKGHLCVFAAEEENSTQEFFGKKFPLICPDSSTNRAEAGGALCISSGKLYDTADPFGFGVLVFAEKAGTVIAAGSWAVTAE